MARACALRAIYGGVSFRAFCHDVYLTNRVSTQTQTTRLDGAINGLCVVQDMACDVLKNALPVLDIQYPWTAGAC